MVTTRNGTTNENIGDRLKPTSKLNVQEELNHCELETSEPNKKYTCFLGEFETRIYWVNAIGLMAFHIGAIYGLLIRYPAWIYTWEFFYGILVCEVTMFGITAGPHRYWTHRSFKAKLPLKIIFLLCYTLSGQHNILTWVRDHRVHHKYSDTDADPYNASRGFWFSHVGWICMKKHPEVLRRGKAIDVSDITSDPLVAFHLRHWKWMTILFCFVIPTIIPPLVFGREWGAAIWANCFYRYCLTLNFTWSVNSVAHTWGNKPFNKNIQPTDNKFVSVATLGEGWHNYHHSSPWDYRAAELGTTINMTTFLLNIFSKIGWAYDLKTASPELVESFVKSKGDGSHRSIKNY